MHVTVWGDFFQERHDPRVRAQYPDGIHHVVAEGLREALGESASVHTATVGDPDHGLGATDLAKTDVLVWWGHLRHDEVADEVVERVCQRVLEGMGCVALHSALESKPFRRLMGTSCNASRWRQGNDSEAVWTVSPSHPIAGGVAPVFVIPTEEVYCEYFDIPPPDELVYQLVYGRRGLPQRLLLPARERARLLLPARPRRAPGLLSARGSPSHCQRRRMGLRRGAGAPGLLQRRCCRQGGTCGVVQ